MQFQLRLCKVDNSLGIVLPEEALHLLGAKEGDTLTSTDEGGGTLRLSALRPETARQMERAEDILQRYQNTLRELAK